MGQHKYNPNCQLAKEGKLPPKPKGLSKRERDRLAMHMIYDKIGMGSVERALGIDPYKEADAMADLLRTNMLRKW